MQLDIKKLGDTLREARTDKKLSQGDLEVETGVKQNVISAIERGVYAKGVTENHRIIATHFGVEILEDEKGDMAEEKAVTNGNGNGAIVELAPMRAITVHKTADGVDKVTDALITCVLGLEPLDQKQRARVMRSLAAWVEE